jgi:outer membrane protein
VVVRIRQGLMVILTLAVFLFPQSAVGEEKPLWEAGAGVALLYMPDYRGSDEKRVLLLPYPYLIYRGDILRVDRERISGRIFQTDSVLLDVSFFGNVPVNSSKNDARRGMPDLDPIFEIGPSLSITLLENRHDPYKLSLALPLRAVFSTNFSSLHHEGWVFNPRLVFEKPDLIPKSGLNLGISAGPMFADSAYHYYFYSVEPAYATASRPSYAAGGGYGGSTLSIGLNKKFGALVFNFFVGMDFLQGAVMEDSPLVKNKTSVMSGFTVSWVFLKSETLVPAGR